jgi:signal peptidase I
MSRVHRSHEKQRWSPGKKIEAVLGVVILVPLLGAGGIALLHLTGLTDPHPLVRLVIVDGDSMEPTFHPGEQLLFLRRPWGVGSIVLAEVGEANAVVKRVREWQGDRVVITGDNHAVTATYRLSPDKIIATFFCRTRLNFPPPRLGEKPASP